jgi:hypothetical protein
MNSFIKNFLLVASAVVFCAFISSIDLNAQVRQPTPTPTPEGGVVIISRDDDFPDNTRIVTEPSNDRDMRSLEEKVANFNLRMKELGKRVNDIESSKDSEYDAKQKRLLLNLDILSKAESRAENLRRQLIELIEKENEIKSKLDSLEYQLRPEMIERTVALTGSLRPEELREIRRKSIQSEQTNMQSLLLQIQTNKADLEENVRKADLLVDKLRKTLEVEIDKALADDDEDN